MGLRAVAWWHGLRDVVAIGVLYALAARLGFVFAIPPGNVTAVWLPSGLALAAILLRGPSRLPGVFAGSFAVNAWFLADAHGIRSPAALGAAAGIALASALQTWLIARVIRARLGADPPMQPREVFAFVGYVAGGCVVAATGGVAVLHAIGTVARTALAGTWFTWWLGDLCGILVVTPLALVALHHEEAPTPWHTYGVFPLICLGFGTSFGVAFAVHALEDRTVEARFDGRARSYVTSLQRSVDQGSEELEALAAVLRRRDTLDRRRFRELVAPALGRNPSISAISWVPRVPASERARYEQSLRDEGFPDSAIKDGSTAGRLVPAAAREAYFAVTWIEPLAPNASAVGYDIGSERLRAEALREVARTGRSMTTEPLRLVQSFGSPMGFLILWPVVASEADSGGVPRLEGVASGVFRVEALVRGALRSIEARAIDVYVFDGPRLLYHHLPTTAGHPLASAPAPSRDELRALPHREGTVHLPGRQWTVLSVPRAVFLAQARTYQPWLALLGGILVTALLAVYAHGRHVEEARLHATREELEQRVRDRTREIDEARRDLELRVQERTHELVVSHERLVAELRERARAERELSASEERFRLLGESTVDAIILADERGAILHWNHAAEVMFGRPAAEMLGQSLQTVIPERHRAAHAHAMEQTVQTGQGRQLGRTLALDGLRRDGSEFPIELSLAMWVEDTRTVFCGIVRDITERRRLESALHQSQKMDAVGRLAGGVAHDFNNLLTVILGCADVLLTRSAPGSEEKELAEEIHAAAERAAKLTSQLMAFGRTQPRKAVVVDLAAVLDNLERMLRRLIREDIALVSEAAAGDLCVRADVGQIEQVVINLVVNARDAMPRGGRLTIGVGAATLDADAARRLPGIAPGSYVALRVTDTGCGMEPAVVARIFEPFYTTKGPGRGTGLGLATVYGIVQQSGGAVEVASTPGTGTTFTVYLPRVAEAPEALDRGASDAAPRPARETILLVEDEDGVRSLARRILEGQGYRVLEARDGAEALARCEREAFTIDLLLTDVVMPGMSGRQLAEALERARPGLRVLYVSGHTGDALGRHGTIEPGLAFLEKPFTPARLVRRVAEVLHPPIPS